MESGSNLKPLILKLFITVCLLVGFRVGMVESCVLIIEGAAIATEKDYFAIEHDFMFSPRVREI